MTWAATTHVEIDVRAYDFAEAASVPDVIDMDERFVTHPGVLAEFPDEVILAKAVRVSDVAFRSLRLQWSSQWPDLQAAEALHIKVL